MSFTYPFCYKLQRFVQPSTPLFRIIKSIKFLYCFYWCCLWFKYESTSEWVSSDFSYFIHKYTFYGMAAADDDDVTVAAGNEE